MSNLTAAVIACYERFAKRVVDFLNANSVEKKTKRVINPTAFETIVNVAFRPTSLAPVMHNGESLKARGRTKQRFQKRYPKTKPDGTPHPQADMLMFTRTGEPLWSLPHAQMFTAKEFWAWRSEQTGLKSKEATYILSWDKVSEQKRQGLAKAFPPKRDGKPEFVPQVAAILVRKGNKPVKGEKRHAWQRLMLLVVGQYGEFGTCIIPNAAVWCSNAKDTPKEQQTNWLLGKALGIPEKDIPFFEPEAEEESLAKAANSLMAVQQHGIDIDFDF